MYVRHVTLTDFRSWAHIDIELTPGRTVFVGPNGFGKTNLVEALWYSATLGSHRVGADAPLIRTGAERAVVSSIVVNDGRELAVLDHLAATVGVGADDVVGWDVVAFDTAAPVVFGPQQEFLASGRLDNLTGVHAGLTALLEAAPTDAVHAPPSSAAPRPPVTLRSKVSTASGGVVPAAATATPRVSAVVAPSSSVTVSVTW